MLWIFVFDWNVWNNKAQKMTRQILRNWSRTKNILKKPKKWFKISKSLTYATLKLHERKKISKNCLVIFGISICVKLCHNNNINSITTVEVIQRSLQFWLIKLKLLRQKVCGALWLLSKYLTKLCLTIFWNIVDYHYVQIKD